MTAMYSARWPLTAWQTVATWPGCSQTSKPSTDTVYSIVPSVSRRRSVTRVNSALSPKPYASVCDCEFVT